jgi:hypothetical protein
MASKIVNVICFGDGVAGGNQTDPGPTSLLSREGWFYLANQLSNLAGKVNLNSQGHVGGLTQDNEMTRLTTELPFLSAYVDVVLFQAWGNADNNLVANYATQIATVQAAQLLVSTAGLAFVPYILAPPGSGHQASDYLLAYANFTTWLQTTYPTTFWNPSTLVADPASPTNWLAANSGDNISPSQVGGAIIAASANTTLYSILKNAFGYNI